MMSFTRPMILVAVVLVSGCGNPPPVATAPATASAATTPAPESRPASPVKVRIISPLPNAVVHGSVLHIVAGLDGGTIVQTTSTHIRPDQGHVHIYLDNNLIYMNYSLTQDVPVHLGENGTLRAEFVAADHFPFNPRVVTPDIFFSVQP